MKIKSLIGLLSVVIFWSCREDPGFPDTPRIEFRNVYFKDMPSGQDSLVVEIYMEDGDGNLGLEADEIGRPFNEKNYYNRFTGEQINTSQIFSLGDLITINQIGEIDTLPPYEGDALCLNWDDNPPFFYADSTDMNGNPVPVDTTLYFQFNPRYNNIEVDYLVQNGTEFEKFDWRLEVDCSLNYDGRFPRINRNDSGPVEGTIKYKMPSFGFVSLFDNEIIKLRIRIIDRAGNMSNTVESPPFNIRDVQIN